MNLLHIYAIINLILGQHAKITIFKQTACFSCKKQIFGSKNKEKRKKIWNLLHYLLILQMI